MTLKLSDNPVLGDGLNLISTVELISEIESGWSTKAFQSFHVIELKRKVVMSSGKSPFTIKHLDVSYFVLSEVKHSSIVLSARHILKFLFRVTQVFLHSLFGFLREDLIERIFFLIFPTLFEDVFNVLFQRYFSLTSGRNGTVDSTNLDDEKFDV